MGVIIRLQNLPLSASAMDIRVFFHGLAIPDGGVHIVGGQHGDAFIAFSSDEDARQAMNLSGEKLKESEIKLLLSSRNEMFKVIEQARQPVPELTEQLPTLSASQSPQNLLNNASTGPSLGESRGMNSSVPINLFDQSSSTLNPMNNNAIPIPNVNMSMGGFPSGLNMGLPNNGLNPFNMKLTPQQLNSFVSSGVGMPGIFPQQTAGIPTGMAQPQNNAFMLPNNNMAFGVGGPNQMVHTNPLAFGGIPSGMLPHGMLPGMMNQPPPQLQSNATQPVVGNVPNPFNQPVHGLRPGGRNQAGGNLNQPYLGLTNIPNSNILHDPNSLHAGVQQNPQLHNGTTGRQNFHQDVDRNLPNRNDASKALGSQFRQNPTSTVEQNRDRGMNQNQNRERMLMDRERDRERDRQPVAEKVSSMGRRRSDSAERRHTVTRPSDRRKRSRSRSRDVERSRRDGKRSRSRSRSRSRQDPVDRPTSSGRRNSTRGDSRERPSTGHDARNVSGNEQDLIIDETEGIGTGSACLMLSNVPNEASYRDVREFLRADARLYGVMRDYEKGTACIRLDNPSDLDRVLRGDGRKLYDNSVRVEAVSLQVFEQQAKKHGAPIEPNRKRDRSKDFGDREQPREFMDRNRDGRGRERERELRHHKDHGRASGDCCLIINGLPVITTDQDVANITLDGVNKDQYGDIHIHEECADRQGRRFATAYVKFRSGAEADKAAALITNTQGAHLRAHVTDVEELDRIRRVHRVFIPSPTKTGHDAKPLFDMDLNNKEVSCNVMLKGVPLTMSERDVFDFFSDVGLRPKRTKLLTDAQTGNRIGKIVCEFNDVAQARQAVMKDGHVFGRTTIGVRMLPRRGDVGPPPGGRTGGILGNRPTSTFITRFQQPVQNDSENPFVQALNAAVSGGPPMGTDHPMRGNPRGGMRGRGLPRGRGGVRPSRFAPADSTTNDHNHSAENASNPPPQFNRPGCVLELTNIPFSARVEPITAFVEETLEKNMPRDSVILRLNELNKPTGEARVAFNSYAETKQAFERLNGSRMWGRVLEASILNRF